jgi:Uma2 family endonuclease
MTTLDLPLEINLEAVRFNPMDQQAEIYRPGQGAEVRSLPTQLSGESVLPGFVLDVSPFA